MIVKLKVTQEGIDRTRAFHVWCGEVGYFPHSKYFEAFTAGAHWNAEKTGSDCDRPEGCVCGGDTLGVRQRCGYYVGGMI